jgi:hypothetical protein
MLRFQVIVQGLPALTAEFDDARNALAALPRMFVEPDGSFVWRGSDAVGSEWQVDGNLVDRGESLAHVELKGCCPAERFDEILKALGWPRQTLTFQLPQRGVVLEEREFRLLADADAGAV